MQTFLPYPEYCLSAIVLDKSRAGNQVWKEGWPLSRGKWPNHPASKMWQGHQHSLCDYLLCIVDVLKEREWARPEIIYKWGEYLLYRKLQLPDTGPPLWLGDERLHSSHRAALLHKKPEWYSQYGWAEEPKLDYYWPV